MANDANFSTPDLLKDNRQRHPEEYMLTARATSQAIAIDQKMQTTLRRRRSWRTGLLAAAASLTGTAAIVMPIRAIQAEREDCIRFFQEGRVEKEDLQDGYGSYAIKVYDRNSNALIDSGTVNCDTYNKIKKIYDRGELSKLMTRRSNKSHLQLA